MFGRSKSKARISRKKLKPMDPSNMIENYSLSKTGQKRPKVHLRYGRLSDIKNKGTLISTIIEEHMLKFGYLDSYDFYINEVAMKNTMEQQKEEKFYNLSELRNLVEMSVAKGDLKHFLQFWERLVKRIQCAKPNFERDQRLEFKLRVYMAIFHLHPFSGTKLTDEDRIVEITSRRLQNFNEYLGEQGAHFVEDDEFSPYFSVPYILTSDDDETDNLQHIFEKDWIDALMDSLKFDLDEMCEGMEESDGQRTLLEEMADHFIRNSAKGEINFDANDSVQEYEAIEKEAQEATDEIRNLEEINEAEKFELNNLATKYELLKAQYDHYLAIQEQKMKLDLTHSNCHLVIPKKQNPAYLQGISQARKGKTPKANRKGAFKIKRGASYVDNTIEQPLHPVIKTVFTPADRSKYYVELKHLWTKMHSHLLDKGFTMLDLIEKDKKGSHDYVKLKVDFNEYMEFLEQAEMAHIDDADAVFDFADNLNGFDREAGIARVYNINEKEMTDKIIQGDAYDSEAILCYLLQILKDNQNYEFDGIEEVVIYAFDKFGEMRDEFLDPEDIRKDKFDDREFLYDLMTAFIFYMCSREDVRTTLRESDFIVMTFNQFQDFVDAQDNLLEELGILGKMNKIIYRVLHLIKDCYLGIQSKIDDEQLLKNLLNLVLNQDTYKLQEEYKEEVLSVIYTLIYMNSGVFDTMLDFHIKSLVETLVKELTYDRGVVFNTIVFFLLLRLSPHENLTKISGLPEILESMKSDFEDDRHFMWLYIEATDRTHVLTREMFEEVDMRLESVGFEMEHDTIKIDEKTAEERLWYYEKKSIMEKTLRLQELRKEEEDRKKAQAEAEKAEKERKEAERKKEKEEEAEEKSKAKKDSKVKKEAKKKKSSKKKKKKKSKS